MAKIAPSVASQRVAPTFPKLPKLDLDALFGAYKANLAVAHQTQTVLVDAAQVIARVQQAYLEQSMARTRAVLGNQERRTPEAALAEVKAVAEQTVAVTKEIVDLAVAAQRRVVELVVRRGAANADQVKTLVAA
jgi:hypothetical protein